MLKYPNAADWVAYNVPAGGLLPDSNLENQPFIYAGSVAEVGPLQWGEACGVHEYVYRAIAKYRRASKLPLLTATCESTWSRLSVGDPLGDRTVPVVFTSFALIDERFVSFLQSDILTKYPLWRIVHCEDSDRPDLNLAVYPDAVSVGSGLASRNTARCLDTWREGIARFQEPRVGPRRRQLEFVQARVLSSPPKIWKSSAPVVIAAFDNDDGDRTVQAVWLVVYGKSPFDDCVDGEDLQEGDFYSISRNGRIGELTAFKSPTRLWIRQVVFPKRHSQRIYATRGGTGTTSQTQVRKFVSDSATGDEPFLLQ